VPGTHANTIWWFPVGSCQLNRRGSIKLKKFAKHHQSL
jgi:hypothetical protein